MKLTPEQLEAELLQLPIPATEALAKARARLDGPR